LLGLSGWCRTATPSGASASGIACPTAGRHLGTVTEFCQNATASFALDGAW
jgi:hypothetical protein